MACCAVGPCDNSAQRGGPGCYLCDVIARLPDAGSAALEDFVKEGTKATRDGEPTLAAARKRGNLAFQKRQRQGPNYVPHNRRVE